MNRYASGTFDFVRGWKNAVGSRTLTEAGTATLSNSTTTSPTPINASTVIGKPILVAEPVTNTAVRPTTAVSSSAPPVGSTINSGPSPSVESSMSGGSGGGGGGSDEGGREAVSGSSEGKSGSNLSVKDKVNTFLFISMMITGLYLIGTNVKFGKQGK